MTSFFFLKYCLKKGVPMLRKAVVAGCVASATAYVASPVMGSSKVCFPSNRTQLPSSFLWFVVINFYEELVLAWMQTKTNSLQPCSSSGRPKNGLSRTCDAS